jgi:hypothetical protein
VPCQACTPLSSELVPMRWLRILAQVGHGAI